MYSALGFDEADGVWNETGNNRGTTDQITNALGDAMYAEVFYIEDTGEDVFPYGRASTKNTGNRKDEGSLSDMLHGLDASAEEKHGAPDGWVNGSWRTHEYETGSTLLLTPLARGIEARCEYGEGEIPEQYEGELNSTIVEALEEPGECHVKTLHDPDSARDKTRFTGI